jgi:hypothetical protein
MKCGYCGVLMTHNGKNVGGLKLYEHPGPCIAIFYGSEISAHKKHLKKIKGDS